MNILCKSTVTPTKNVIKNNSNKSNVIKSSTLKRVQAKTNRTPIQRIDNNEIKKYLVKAERVNGRCAMIGFSAAVAEEFVTHQPVMEQFMDNVGLAVTVIGLVIVGTASNPKDEGFLWGVFNRQAEIINGRAAMIGLISLLISESVKNPQIPLF